MSRQSELSSNVSHYCEKSILILDIVEESGMMAALA